MVEWTGQRTEGCSRLCGLLLYFLAPAPVANQQQSNEHRDRSRLLMRSSQRLITVGNSSKNMCSLLDQGDSGIDVMLYFKWKCINYRTNDTRSLCGVRAECRLVCVCDSNTAASESAACRWSCIGPAATGSSSNVDKHRKLQVLFLFPVIHCLILMTQQLKKTVHC